MLGVHEFTLVRSVNGTAPPRGEEGPDLRRPSARRARAR
ncbi:hypothetical protein FM106_08870 [Brachybacterium faecium]|nr:hypothetical protein FM106_08870 [Brachybacterium faecium]